MSNEGIKTGLNVAPDTTAHTLTATLGLLGLYPDVQEEVYQQIMEAAPTDADMVSISSFLTRPLCQASLQTFQNSANLYKVRAAFLEGGRLYRTCQLPLGLGHG